MKSNDLKMDKADNFQYISGMYFPVVPCIFGCDILGICRLYDISIQFCLHNSLRTFRKLLPVAFDCLDFRDLCY